VAIQSYSNFHGKFNQIFSGVLEKINHRFCIRSFTVFNKQVGAVVVSSQKGVRGYQNNLYEASTDKFLQRVYGSYLEKRLL